MRKSLLALAVLGTLSASALVFADDAAPADAAAAPTPAYTITTNVGLWNNYIFRGLTQTSGEPAIQGGVDFTHSSGLYLGAWGSNESWLADSGAYKDSSIELDIYGGYRNTIGDTGLSYDVGLIQVIYPGTRQTVTLGNGPQIAPRADTTEVYAALTYSILTAKVNYAATNEYGWKNSDGSYYLDLTANYPVPAEWTGISGLSVVGHVGHQKINAALADTGGASASYTDYKLGLSKAWDNGVTVGGY